MQINPPKTKPPFKCVYCERDGSFTSGTHIIPHSLGNDLLVLAPGWVCDDCNNICSAFESTALNNSILGIERCRLGVVTKRGKPARSQVHSISWFAEPNQRPNIVSVEAKWDKIPMRLSPDGNSGKIVLPFHDNSCYAISKLLLKIGVEVLAPITMSNNEQFGNLRGAKNYILGKEDYPWPYFVIRNQSVEKHLLSVFHSVQAEHEYILSCGFDLFLHEVEEHVVLFFRYGEFRAAISLSSRETGWREVFSEWEVPYVGCPAEFKELSA
jgi:hypothetical protein